jgi:hypothetical protein
MHALIIALIVSLLVWLWSIRAAWETFYRPPIKLTMP